ncbi:phytanoyl-CoA dioxygenase family protein [Sphingomonas koreensis]
MGGDDPRREAWHRDGFFVVRQLIPGEDAAAIEAEVIAAIAADPPSGHPGGGAYVTADDYLIYPEKRPSPRAKNPEDFIAKVFNCHGRGMTRSVAARDAIISRLVPLLGDDIDCFQSQFIFKNPGVMGQPWHQDGWYFRFDRPLQVGVWVALSRATLENGCLWVVPGSHRSETIFDHVPDSRLGSLNGYQEIVSEDTSREEPVLMEPGDVLFFHSYLMHRSTDNVAEYRRSAMVYHFAPAGTQPLDAEAAQRLAVVNRWIPACRAGVAVAA